MTTLHPDALADLRKSGLNDETIIGIAGLKDTLEDRAVPLVMLRRRKTETVARIGRATDAEAQALRDHCALAALTRSATSCRPTTWP